MTFSTATTKPQTVGATPMKAAPAGAIKTVPAKPAPTKTEPVKPQASVLPSPPVKPALSKPNRVLLELVQPGAKQVCVAGSFNGWRPEKTPLAQQGNGRWVGDLAVNPGRHEYLFVVDGQWLPDPNAKESVQNPFGGKNSVLLVSE